MKFINKSLAVLLTLTAVFTMACATTQEKPKPLNATAQWNNHKGNCDQVLKTPHGYTLSEVANCTKLWESYRYVNELDIGTRSKYAVAFSMVSHKSDDVYDQMIANVALARVCIPRHPMGNDGQIREEIPDMLECQKLSEVIVSGGGGGYSSPNNVTSIATMKRSIPVKEVSAASEKASSTAYKKAAEQRKKQSMGRAISYYRDALENNPFNVSAKYDLATLLALEGDEDGALAQLTDLYKWDDEEAQMKLSKASFDDDFASIRDNMTFKQLTGYVRISIFNGTGNLGINDVESIRKKLEKKKIPIAESKFNDTIELAPKIVYREGYEDYAENIKNILKLKNLKLVAMKEKDAMNDVNDIRIIWGDPKAREINGQDAPIVTGDRAQGSDDIINDIANKIESGKKQADSIKKLGTDLSNIH